MTVLPTDVVDFQAALGQMGAVVPPYDDGDLGAYKALLRERLRVLSSTEGTWWRLT